VAAVAGAVTAFEVPPVPFDTAARVGRAQSRSLTTTGAVVSSPSYREFLHQKKVNDEAEIKEKVDRIATKVSLKIYNA
jgi:hypothetical protein